MIKIEYIDHPLNEYSKKIIFSSIFNKLINIYEKNEIIKLVCVDSKGNVGSPCGACREYMMQLSKNSKDIEILKKY